jgi:hypothetical protein
MNTTLTFVQHTQTHARGLSALVHTAGADGPVCVAAVAPATIVVEPVAATPRVATASEVAPATDIALAVCCRRGAIAGGGSADSSGRASLRSRCWRVAVVSSSPAVASAIAIPTAIAPRVITPLPATTTATTTATTAVSVAIERVSTIAAATVLFTHVFGVWLLAEHVVRP